ncbi:hypothetical protein BYT27DRAFT_7201894 [Phlegmacium glaucopus]|nr:hypothetical protein BYT27DRAFT_7201894 [Phlegmacium glaucopus]
MSSMLAYFQAPVHPGAHMYRHSEMDSQQPYPSNGYSPYLIDYPGFSADADHAENLDDEAQYSRLPPGTRPRPSLLPSPFSHQYSWSDWPSEAPINVYQAYSEPSSQQHTSPLPHSPHAAEVQLLQYSFENQQAVLSKFYPAGQEFEETAPNRVSSPFHYEDSAYTQQPFLASIPSFQVEQGPTQSNHWTNIQPRYHAAHQPIPPEKRSSYSELAPNLSFMNNNNQAWPPLVRQETIQTQDHRIPKSTSDDIIPRTCATPSRDIKKNPYAFRLNGPPLTSIGRKMQTPQPTPSDYPVVVDTTAVPTTSTTTKTKSSRSINEPRRPSLACTFCRERKIACGRPPDGSPDPTCK